MSVLVIIAIAVALGILYVAGRPLARRRRARASLKRARGPLLPAAQQVQDRMRALLGRTDVLIAATKTTSFQPSAEVVEVALIDTTGAVRLDRAILPTGTITREATAAHGIDRDELLRVQAPRYPAVHAELEAALDVATVVLAYDAVFERRVLHRTAASHELELPETTWECVKVAYSEYYGQPAKRGDRGLRTWTLGRAAAREGITTAQPHLRALGDCRTTLHLLHALTGTADPAGS